MFHSKFLYFKILFFVFLSFLFIFLTLHIFLVFNLKYETEVTYCADVSKKINSYGVIFKDEKILDYCEDGEVIKNIYRDGSHVAADSEIARKYYKESDVKNLEKIEKIDEKIKNLEETQKFIKNSNFNFNDLNNQVYRNYFELCDAIKQNNSQLFSKKKNEIIDCLNKKQILIGRAKNFNDSIKNLKKNRALISNLVSAKPKKIRTPISGYVVSKIDSFENECSLEAMKSLDVEKLQKIYDYCEKNRNKFKLGNKIIYNPQIFFKMLLPTNLMIDCSVGSTCVLKMQQNGEEVDAELVDLNLGKNGQKGLATFEINSMTDKLASTRQSKVEVNFKKYYGLKISKIAIRKNKKNQTGVYVKIGAIAKFKLVDILTENDDYIISKIHDDSDDYVRELDEVIVKGKNLYDRKKIK